MKKELILQFIIFLLIGFILGILIGKKLYTTRDLPKNELNSTLILERIKKHQFLVTRTVLFTEEVSIKIEKDSKWTSLLWGQQINAYAPTQVDIGVDLSGLTETDLTVNNVSKKIIIDLPPASIKSTSITGKLNVKTKDGILKSIFSKDTNADYNFAISKIKEEAEKSVKDNSELLKSAEDTAIEFLNFLFNSVGYSVEKK